VAKDNLTLKQTILGGVYALLQAAGLVVFTVGITKLLQVLLGQ